MPDVYDDNALQERADKIQQKLAEGFKDMSEFLTEAFELATKIERERICLVAEKVGLHAFSSAIRDGGCLSLERVGDAQAQEQSKAAKLIAAWPKGPGRVDVAGVFCRYFDLHERARMDFLRMCDVEAP